MDESVRRKKRAKRVRVFLILTLLSITWFLTGGLLIGATTKDLIRTDAREIPAEPVAIVFGAGIAPNGGPSLILKYRLDGAIELFKEGKVPKLLMSGDNRRADYNEPAVMRDYAVRHGVPSEDIVLDYAGRDTYDTCYRAKTLFGYTRAVLVTQRYHAPRAVYVAKGLGLDAVALGVPNLDRYPGLQFTYNAREYLADWKALWDVNVSHRKPYVSAHSGH